MLTAHLAAIFASAANYIEFNVKSDLDGCSYTGDGTRHYWNATPLAVTAPPDTPVFEYAFDGTGQLGLRIDSEYTNLVSINRQLDNPPWTPAASMSVANTATGIDGVANAASTLTAGAANSTLLHNPITVVSGSAYIFSAYVKRVTGNGRVDITTNGQDAQPTWKDITAYLLPGSWWQVSIAFVASGTTAQIGFRVTENGDAISADSILLQTGNIQRGPSLTGGQTVYNDNLFCPDISNGKGYNFLLSDFPSMALRGRVYLEKLVFSDIVFDTSAKCTVTYLTNEIGNPRYTDTAHNLPLVEPAYQPQAYVPTPNNYITLPSTTTWTDGPNLCVTFSIKTPTTFGNNERLLQAGGYYVDVYVTAGKNIRIRLFDDTLSLLYDGSTTTALVANTQYTLEFAARLGATPTVDVKLDSVTETMTEHTAPIQGNIDFSRTSWGYGCITTGANLADGYQMGPLWIGVQEVDLSVVSFNTGKTPDDWSTNGDQADGARPTGENADRTHYMGAGNRTLDVGKDGANFIENGTPTYTRLGS